MNFSEREDNADDFLGLSDLLYCFRKKDVGDDDPSRPSTRFSSILTSVQNFGDYEKLQSGVFENYLKCKFRDSYFQAV